MFWHSLKILPQPIVRTYSTRATPLDPNYISTYYQNSLTWEDAAAILVVSQAVPPFIYRDINRITFWDSSTIVTGTEQGLVSGIGTIVTNSLPGGTTAYVPSEAGKVNVWVKDTQGHVVGRYNAEEIECRFADCECF